MGLIGKLFGRSARPPVPSESRRQLKLYDNEGREFLIDWAVYRTNVLPKQFSDAGSDPEKLYGTIVIALKDEFFAEAIAPSRRLLTIDNDSERATTVLGIALMRSGELAEAQQIFEDYLRRHGDCGTVLTNLAKVYSSRGDEDFAEKILWRSLEADPNQTSGLDWWGAIHSERGGKQAFLNAMAQVASIRGSYRAQLWIAREYLKSDRVEEALDTYRMILPLVEDDGEGLRMLTGDLGNSGRIKVAVIMVLPFYRPTRHGPAAGINLVKGLIEMERYGDARGLLNELDDLGRVDFKAILDELRASMPN